MPMPKLLRRSGGRVLRRVGRTPAGRAIAAGLTPMTHPGGSSAEASVVPPRDAVEFGHRLILGRAPSPELRDAMLAELAAGRTTPAQAWASLAASPEFAGRVVRQRALVEAAEPPADPDRVLVDHVRDAQSIEAHNASAESYFAGRDDDAVEQMLTKPYATAAETTELLTCFGHIVNGLQLVPGDRLLDFGVGTGWTSWMFAQLRAEVVLADVSAAGLDHARRRFDRWPLSAGRVAPSFTVFDGHQLDLADDSIDKICCFDAFHHLVNQAEVMQEFARVLKPGGLLGFSEPGLHHSKTAQAQYEMATFGVIEGDVRLEEMDAMARAAGLEFVHADVLTSHPIWVSLDRFTDLVENQVLDADTSSQLAVQVQTKQQFVLRKPGGSGLDSRTGHALKADLAVEGLRLERTDTGATLRGTVRIANTGEASWLPNDGRIGAVGLGVRAKRRSGWEARLTTDRDLTLRPGERADVEVALDLPADLLDDALALNLVAEQVTWFDLAGTPAVVVELADLSG